MPCASASSLERCAPTGLRTGRTGRVVGSFGLFRRATLPPHFWLKWAPCAHQMLTDASTRADTDDHQTSFRRVQSRTRRQIAVQCATSRHVAAVTLNPKVEGPNPSRPKKKYVQKATICDSWRGQTSSSPCSRSATSSCSADGLRGGRRAAHRRHDHPLRAPPSVMKLRGGWNWYLPRWLEWLPRLQVEGASSTGTKRTSLESGRS